MLLIASGETIANFKERLISQIDINGNAGTDYGPHMQRILINTFNNFNTVRIDDPVTGANTEGWRFDSTTSAFQANDSADHATF